MDGERATGFLLGDHGAGENALLEIGPWPLASDLADDAGADLGAPRALLHLVDHFLGKAVDAAVVIGRVLVVMDVVAAAHDDVSAGLARDLGQSLRIGLQAADRQFHHGLPAMGDHLRRCARRGGAVALDRVAQVGHSVVQQPPPGMRIHGAFRDLISF